MTLNLTVVSPTWIYQSADYRLTNLQDGDIVQPAAQKIVLANGFTWSATVCFTGIGRTSQLDIGEWLAERVNAVPADAPLDRLVEELLTADQWLATTQIVDRRHSFSIGAFVGSQPQFLLVSNFERIAHRPASRAWDALRCSRMSPKRVQTFVSGQVDAVSRAERRWLADSLDVSPEPESMYAALAEVNKRASRRSKAISPDCFVTHIDSRGRGGGVPLNSGKETPFASALKLPFRANEDLTRLLRQKLGPGPLRVAGVSMFRVENSDEYHRSQIAAEPHSAAAHVNYGAFLKDTKGDSDAAEREYLVALTHDPRHVNAIGNLGNVYADRDKIGQAVGCYDAALAIDPGNENVTWNYARLLVGALEAPEHALRILESGVATNPDSGRLRVLAGKVLIQLQRYTEALEQFTTAREKGGHQSDTEAGIAFALHLTEAPIGECVAAYRSAIAVAPKNGALRLNLAQLLFLRNEYREARKQLRRSIACGLGEAARLEAGFYRLAYNEDDAGEVFSELELLLSKGVRLDWNVDRNVQHLALTNPARAERLRALVPVLRGTEALTSSIVRGWTRR